MKAKTLIAACFGGIGIYQVISGSFSVVASFYLVSAGGDDPSNRRMMVLQYLELCMPFLTGLVFLIFAPTWSRLVCVSAKIGEEDVAGIIQPQVVIMAACVVTGLILA